MSLQPAGRASFARAAFAVALAVALIALHGWLGDPAHAADGVVGNGSPATCTEAAFDATFQAVQQSGGGTITFNCGAAPVTILFSYQRAVSANTELRGAGLITLSGKSATSLFQVYAGQALTLDNITLTRAYGPAGAVESFGKLVVRNSRLTDNAATAPASSS